jgi:hypothetical protein
MPAGSWIFGSTITTITGLTLHWPIERQPNLQQFAAVEMTAIKPPWKTLRVYHIPTARRLLAVISHMLRSQAHC